MAHSCILLSRFSFPFHTKKVIQLAKAKLQHQPHNDLHQKIKTSLLYMQLFHEMYKYIKKKIMAITQALFTTINVFQTTFIIPVL